jgi:4-amino-4-deoxy-L-arabinose transferase-like glycosyltransferase
VTWRAAVILAAPAVVITFAVLLPFLGKAFSIDDVTFLLQAQHVLKDSLHPTAFDMVFHGIAIRLSSKMVSGPVMAWLLVPSVLLGGAEWIAHLIQATFLAVGAVATAALGTRLGLDRTRATIAALLVVVSPAVIAMASTAMPDVNAMTFGVIGMERLVAWRQQRRWSAAFLAALFLALAVLSRPHVLLVFGCGALLIISNERWRLKPWKRLGDVGSAVAPLVMALVILAVVNYATRDLTSGGDLAGATLSERGGVSFWPNLANVPVQWALSFPLAVLWPLTGLRRFLWSRGTGVGFALGALLAFNTNAQSSSWWMGLYVMLVSVGSAVLLDILVDAWERKDKTQIALGLWLLIAASAAPYEHLPAKYLVPAAPAMAILIARAAHLDKQHRLRVALLGVACICGLALGVLIIRADAALGEIGREGGAQAGAQVSQGNRVWMDGAWGFQWYAMQAGAKPMTDTQAIPTAGDVVVVGLQGRLANMLCPHKTLVSRRVFDEPGGRVLSVDSNAGFFSNNWGMLPWSWGHGELGRIEVWRIDP